MPQIPFYAGTYTQAAGHVPRPAGRGIHACYLNTSTGQIDSGAINTEIENPSWLEWRSNDLFAVYESFSGPSAVHRFRVNSDHTLTLRAQASCSGTAVCHFALTDSTLYSAAYASGQMDVYDAPRLRHLGCCHYRGKGPNRSRQQTAHAHQAVVSPEGRRVYVCDLGSDRIWRHRLQPLSDPVGIATPAGSGPRHLVFHRTNGCVYLVAELTAELLTYRYSSETGDLTLFDQTSTLPADFQGTPSGAGISLHPCGHALYYSNRQHNSVSCYSLLADGQPHLLSQTSCGGEEPRAITVDPTGEWLLVANQNSDTIASFRLNPLTGELLGDRPVLAELGTPVCIAFRQ